MLYLGKRAGFTLAEMLVVLGIIGLLMAISLPALSEARRKAKTRIASADVAQISTAIMMYYEEYTNFPPDTSNSGLIDTLTANHAGSNPRRIVFLEVPQGKIVSGEYVDPWGSPYAVMGSPSEITTVESELFTARVHFLNDQEP